MIPNRTKDACDQAVQSASQQRFAFLHMLRINETVASPAELALYARIKNAKSPEALDMILTEKLVLDLFSRRVLFYGDKP